MDFKDIFKKIIIALLALLVISWVLSFALDMQFSDILFFVIIGTVAIIIFVYQKNQEAKLREQQLEYRMTMIEQSIIFILRNALTADIANMLGLSNSESRGFEKILRHYIKNVCGFKVFYKRKINAPELDEATQEQIRDILNGELKNAGNLIYTDGTFYLYLYVHSIKSDKSNVQINVIAAYDTAAEALITEHKQLIEKQRIIGNENSENENNGDILYDE